MEEKMFDVTGAELHPGDPAAYQGNGEHPGFECCCDECDYFLESFPNWKEMLQGRRLLYAKLGCVLRQLEPMRLMPFVWGIV